MIFFYCLMGGVIILASCLIAFSMPLSRMKQALLTMLITISATALYGWLGAYPQLAKRAEKLKDQTLARQVLASVHGKSGLIQQLEKKIQSQHGAQRAKGHYLLAKLYASEGQWLQAVDNFKQAYLLQPEQSSYQINLAYALWQQNHQQQTSQSLNLFKGLLEKDPNQVDALTMLAMDAYQNKHYEQAILYWRRLLSLAPPNSKDSRSIEAAIDKARQLRENKTSASSTLN